MSLFPLRHWRRLAVSILPEFVKAPLRKRLHGSYRPGNPVPLLLRVDSNEGLTAVVDNKIEFKVSAELESSLRFQCQDNAEAAAELRSFLTHALNATVLFDVGAYAGLFSLIFCAAGPMRSAVAFEPSPAMQPILRNLVDLNDFAERIHVANVAVGDQEGRINLSLESSGFVQIVGGSEVLGEVQVPMKTLDAVCAEMSIEPDLLKIDVEGFESEVLHGAANLLRRKMPVILLELHLNYLEKRGLQPKHIIDYLDSFDYSFFSCEGRPLLPSQIYDSIKPIVRFVARPKSVPNRSR